MIGKLKFNELIVNSLLKYAGIIKYLAYINLFLISLFIILNIIFPLNIKINYSRLVLSKDGKILTSFLSIDDKWRYESKINEISEYVRTSFLFKEDKYFYYHPGVNPVSMLRAFFDNITEGEIKSGASTITMQLARMLEPKKRSYFNKLIEIFRAFQLETFYSKDEILEMYLNKVPFGSNIEGIYAASYLYLNKYPNKLSLSQATALSVIPNAPNKLAIGFNNQLIYQEKNKWLKRMKASGVFTTQIIDAAIQEPFEAKRRDSPKYAVQLSNRLSAGNRSKSIVNSTIDYETQFNTERICYNYINSLKFFNINNCSVIIIDNKTKEVKAYIGSNDFSDTENYGQVDGVTAVRSPGSTLKPFLYSLAFDKGLITPKQVVLDVPIISGDYKPENFDGKYRGRITVEDALINSLNIPAVNILNQYGVLNFIDKLEEANFSSITLNRKNLGLSMILGGCGVTLEELTNLFSIFANNGYYSNLLYHKSDTIYQRKKILSPEASYIISEIITKIARPDLPRAYTSARGIPVIAWKTGTSQGRRDAWSIGFNDTYTIGVWVGNFSGKGNQMIAGADIATPLLFDIFNSLTESQKSNWLQMPKNLAKRDIDPLSGFLPGEFTEYTIKDYYLPGISSNQYSNEYKEVWVSENEKTSYCQDCVPLTGIKKMKYRKVPLELAAYYESNGIIYDKIPPHNEKCTSVKSGNKPLIISPVDNNEYLLEKETGMTITFQAKADIDVKYLFWYINNKFYGVSNQDEKISFTPKFAGKYRISCTDDKGRNTDARIKVLFY